MFRPYHQFLHKKTRGGSGKQPCTVIAHRGASAYYPENTLASFAGAIDMGADMVELDVQLTDDGEVVVFHDAKISRCTNGRGPLKSHTLARLKELDAGGWFHEKFRGEKIPTLAEVLSLCRGRIAVNIEIKTEAVGQTIAGGIEEKCLKMVERCGMRRHVVFSSFDPRAISHIRQIDKRAPVAVLFDKKIDNGRLPSEIVVALGADAFNCSRRELTVKRHTDLKAHNIPVNVYSPNDEEEMRRLVSRGVNGIFTDRPDILRRVLEDF
jgi:glycerophosphoryl diester phosphodiesterase